MFKEIGGNNQKHFKLNRPKLKTKMAVYGGKSLMAFLKKLAVEGLLC